MVLMGHPAPGEAGDDSSPQALQPQVQGLKHSLPSTFTQKLTVVLFPSSASALFITVYAYVKACLISSTFFFSPDVYT